MLICCFVCCVTVASSARFQYPHPRAAAAAQGSAQCCGKCCARCACCPDRSAGWQGSGRRTGSRKAKPAAGCRGDATAAGFQLSGNCCFCFLLEVCEIIQSDHKCAKVTYFPVCCSGALGRHCVSVIVNSTPSSLR